MTLSQQLIEEMEAAAMLPEDDTQRQAVVRAIAQAGPEARQYWLDLLRSIERLRVDMQAVPVPPDLQAKLLAIPQTAGVAPAKTMKMNRALTGRDFLRIAAGLVIVGVLGLAGWGVVNYRHASFEKWQDEELAKMATWAVTTHDAPPADTVATSDQRVLAAEFAKAHMPIMTPILGALGEAKLVGGGHTNYQSAPVVFTRWEVGPHQYTLYEFAPEQLDMSTSFSVRTETPRSLWTADKHYAVMAWSNPDLKCGWLLVMDSESAPLPVGVYTY